MKAYIKTTPLLSAAQTGCEKCASGGDFRSWRRPSGTGIAAGIEPPAARSKNFYIARSGAGRPYRKWLSQGVEPRSPCFRPFCRGQSDPGTRTSLRKWLSGRGRARGAVVVLREPRKSGRVDSRGWPGSAKPRRAHAARNPVTFGLPVQHRRAPHSFRRGARPRRRLVCVAFGLAIE